ncbi:hypothetical protein N4T20_05390 [Flavobacterium sp. TR2]|nr:hypothetical protein [Flavobacterium sp. TR2]UWY29369.1 hypothetical protein N4T20_05390 [Flavobacterium sp. TR2]
MKKDVILKTDQEKKMFVDAILTPPKANEKLKIAYMKHFKFIKSNKAKD